MTTTQLIETLSASGVHLSASQGSLKIDAPAGVLTAEMKAELAKHKLHLLQLVTSRICNRCKNVSLQMVMPGYFTCGCGYQIVEAHSNFWTASKPMESANYCACGMWRNDDSSCPRPACSTVRSGKSLPQERNLF